MSNILIHMIHWLAIGLLSGGAGASVSESSQAQFHSGQTDAWSLSTSVNTLEVERSYSETTEFTLPSGKTVTVTKTVTVCKTGESGCFYNEKKGRYEPDRLQR